MTSPTTVMVAQGGRARVRTRPTCAGTLRDDLRALLAETSGITWPSARYRDDPCAFAEEILGMQVWSKQREILEAIRDHKRVTVRSGHKVGKSNTAAIAALWFYCSFEDARVVFTSVTARQVDSILWREMAKIRSKAGTCLRCRTQAKQAGKPAPKPCPHSSLIDGTLNTLARSGFRARDFREVVGFTAREAEAVAGISGANLLYLPDEASGIPDEIFSAMEGNRAGGARIAMFSNPTRTEGEFFLSHTDKAEKFDSTGKKVGGFYRSIHVSSEDTPNVIDGRDVIPGLATREWVDEKRAEWGEDSPLFKVRVRGEFVLNEDGKIFSVDAITQAEARWEDADARGRLFIGVDPAGPGGAGDESAFAIRRGQKVQRVVARRALTDDAHVVEIVGILEEERDPREPLAVVVIDREGPIGSRIYGLLQAYLARHPGAFVLVGVRASDRAVRAPKLYDRVRDELWANGAEWLRDGGAIPEDTRLAKELHAAEWIQQATGRLKVTPKSELRKMLDGRSPDRADAVLLSLWEPRSLGQNVGAGGELAAAREAAELAREESAPAPGATYVEHVNVSTEDDRSAPDGIDPYGLDAVGEDGGGIYG